MLHKLLLAIGLSLAALTVASYASAACPAGFSPTSYGKCARIFTPNVNNSDGGLSLSSEGSGKKAGLRCAIFHEPGFWSCTATSCTQNGSNKSWSATNCATLASPLPGTPLNRRCDVRPSYTQSDQAAFGGYSMYYKDNEIVAVYSAWSSTPSTNWIRACNFTFPNQGDGFGTGAFFNVQPAS